MDQQTLERTRRSLHGVAELVLAGPQYAANEDIRLRVTPGGFGTVTTPDLRVEQLELVSHAARLPLGGTFAGLARAVGVEARSLRDVYADGPDVAYDDPIMVDAEAVALIVDAFAIGDEALRAFDPDQLPVLWPEHFDIGITAAEINYGVSPGDAHLPEPYAYVGPWTPQVGEFWNTPFGAARPVASIRDTRALLDFFREGAERAVR
jgi:hypothetical protein